MTTEEIIKQILSKNPTISREHLLERLTIERDKTGSLISDVTLLRMIAAEFGVETATKEFHPHKLSIKDLVPSLNDVTVAGRVVAIFPPKNFEGKRSGKFASLFVADKDNLLRIVLWNDKVELIESGAVEVGQVLRISHGYTKEDRSGKSELHISNKSEIEISPEGIETEKYPTIGKFATRINEITHEYKNKRIHLVGTVKELFPSSTFQRQDQTVGKVMRFVLADNTGEVPVVVWNEQADEFEETLHRGAGLQIVNAKVKGSSNGGLEIHVDSGTYVAMVAIAEEFMKIADLKEGQGCVSVKGEVFTKPVVREVRTSSGEIVRIAVFELKDETGPIWVSSWRKNAGIIGSLNVGDQITLKNAYVKRGLGNKPELSTRNATSIIVPS
jgi:ssDNA-binding replication factor A large subunit